jgi:cytidylate kinase
MGSLGSPIAQGVAGHLGYEFLRNDIIRGVARDYRVREAGVIGIVEQVPRLLERWQRRHGRRYRAYLEAAVLDAAARERVVLVGRWSTLFLRGISHAVRVRVCAPPEVRARRVMERHGIDQPRALRRILDYDEGVRARMRQMFDVEWTDPLLYDLVINTASVTVESAVRQVLDLVAAPEFQPTEASRQRIQDRGLRARIRAALAATMATADVELEVEVSGGHVRLAGLVGSDSEREAAVALVRAMESVREVSSDLRVFHRRVR